MERVLPKGVNFQRLADRFILRSILYAEGITNRVIAFLVKGEGELYILRGVPCRRRKGSPKSLRSKTSTVRSKSLEVVH